MQDIEDFLEEELAKEKNETPNLKIPTINFHMKGDLNLEFKEFCPSEEKEEKRLEVKEITSKKTKRGQTEF